METDILSPNVSAWPISKKFSSEEVANGFIQGIRYNLRIRNIKIVNKN
jgi:hypothetical protein